MLSQNTQDSIQQSLFATAMKVNPTVMHNTQLTKPTSGMRQVQMAAAQPGLSGNFNGAQLKSASFNTAGSVQRRNYTVNMSMQSNNNQQIPTNAPFSTRQYLEGPQMNMNQNQENMMKMEQTNMDAFKSASMSTNMNLADKPALQQMKKEQVDQAIHTFNEAKIQEAKPVEEVTFEVKGAEEMPVVVDNHFEGVQTRKEGESLVQNSVNSTYGQVSNFMYNYFKKLQGQRALSQIPVFMAMFAFCSLTPFPAFAATKAAAVAPVVAQSGMTKLLKNVFCAGAAAVFTVSFIHPIDVVKTRMQIAAKGEGSLGEVVSAAMKEEGPGAFYKGIGPAWLREASYTSLRLGLYEPVKALVGANQAGAGFLRKFLAGALAGAIGSCAGNPFDVLKTKMMANKDSNDGLGKYASDIMKAEGLAGFYKGFNTNVIRAMVLNATKMACYDTIKMMLIANFALEGLLLQFCAAFASGFFLTCTVSPFDKCRTLLMNQDPTKEKQFNSLLGCLIHIIKTEGFGGLYKGFIPIWSRFAPTTCLQLITFEQLKRLPFIALA